MPRPLQVTGEKHACTHLHASSWAGILQLQRRGRRVIGGRSFLPLEGAAEDLAAGLRHNDQSGQAPFHLSRSLSRLLIGCLYTHDECRCDAKLESPALHKIERSATYDALRWLR